MKLPSLTQTLLTPILPSSASQTRITIEGGRTVIRIPKQKFEALKNLLGVDRIYLAYEDGNFVIVAGFNGDRSKPRMAKVPKAVIYTDVKSLVRVLGW